VRCRGVLVSGAGNGVAARVVVTSPGVVNTGIGMIDGDVTRRVSQRRDSLGSVLRARIAEPSDREQPHRCRLRPYPRLVCSDVVREICVHGVHERATISACDCPLPLRCCRLAPIWC
jgi:hypothetical protein